MGKRHFRAIAAPIKFLQSDRGVLRVHNGQECVGTLVPVGTDAVERPYAIFDQRDRRVRRSGGRREALRAVSSGGRAL